MEKQQTFKTPNKTLARMQVVHLGKILFNLEFLALAIMLASVLTFILPALYYLVLICIMFLTLFIVFASPEFMSWWNGGETLAKVADAMTQSWKFTVPIALALAAISIVCLCFDKNQKHTARIVVSAIIAVGAAILLIAKLINGGGN